MLRSTSPSDGLDKLDAIEVKKNPGVIGDGPDFLIYGLCHLHRARYPFAQNTQKADANWMS
jgi:hypothetical protein